MFWRTSGKSSSRQKKTAPVRGRALIGLKAFAERRGGLDGAEGEFPVSVQADVVEAAAPHHAGDGVAIYDLDCLIHFEFPLSALVTSGAGLFIGCFSVADSI